MVFIDLQVKHKKFGIGTIVAKDGNYIRVKFESAEKSFVYPDAFEKFLTLADDTVPDEILADLAVSNDRKNRIRAAKDEENRRSMTHGIVIPGKEGTPDSEEEESGYKNSSDAE